MIALVRVRYTSDGKISVTIASDCTRPFRSKRVPHGMATAAHSARERALIEAFRGAGYPVEIREELKIGGICHYVVCFNEYVRERRVKVGWNVDRNAYSVSGDSLKETVFIESFDGDADPVEVFGVAVSQSFLECKAFFLKEKIGDVLTIIM